MAAKKSIPAALLAGFVLAGCGGGGTTTVTDNSPPAVTRTSATVTSTATEPAAPQHLASFRSPSGNIGCMLIAGTARCDIERRSWKPPPRPKSCPGVVDFGQGIEIATSGEARFVCAGDTARDPAAPTLAYGSSTEADGFNCESATSGVTCKRADGHGFFVSIQSYRLF